MNKGMYWAVAKVKVREAVTSYFNQVYNQGGDITVGNVTINKATYSDGNCFQLMPQQSLRMAFILFLRVWKLLSLQLTLINWY